MASKKHFHKNSSIPLIHQKAALCSAYRAAKCKIDRKKNELFWLGTVRPTIFSKTYTVAVFYQLGNRPQIFVIGEELEKLEDAEFPHKFDIDVKNKIVQICLYRYTEFTPSKLLANTIIPWTVEWLYFYELWLTTGQWLGGGEHPQCNDIKDV